MPLSWAAVCKKANDGKHDGVNFNQMSGKEVAKKDITPYDSTRIDEVLQEIKAKAKKIKWNRNPFEFLTYHLRLIILDLVIDPISSPLYLTHRRIGRTFRFPVPDIAKAFDKRNRLECLMVLLEKSRLEIHSGPGLMKLRSFLEYVDFNEIKGKDTRYNLGYDCIRTLCFPYFSRFPHDFLPKDAFNTDVMMMRACKNLKKLSLVWVDEELVSCGDDGYEPKSLEKLRKEYRLDDMLGLKKLEHLSMLLRQTDHVRGATNGMGSDQVRMLGGWIGREYAKRGKGITILY